MTTKELEEKYNDLVYMMCKLNKQIDELQKRCEELEKRESIHNAIDGALNVQKQLDEHSKKIHNIGSYLEPIHKKLDKINERLDAHDEKISDINVRLYNANEKSDKLKARLNMIFGAGGGLHLATYGMSIETNEENTKEAVKIIRNHCRNTPYCYSCMFHIDNEGCMFKDHYPTVWNVEKDK